MYHQLSPTFGDGPHNDSSVSKSPKGTGLSPGTLRFVKSAGLSHVDLLLVILSEVLTECKGATKPSKSRVPKFFDDDIILLSCNGCGQGVPKASL